MDALVADGEAEPGKKEESGPVPITVVGPPTKLDVSQGDGEGTTTPPTTPPAPTTPAPTTPPAPTSYKIIANFAFAGTIQPGGSSSPFGVMNPTISLENCTASTTGDTITIAGTIKGLFEYAWNAGSCVDVPNATASVVTTKIHKGTKKVWEQVRDDLMPSSASPHKSPRDAFWSEALTIRHEKFHATDFHDWVKNTGKADLVAFLGAKTPAAKDNATLGGLLGDAKSNLVTKMFQYYLGGASDPGHSNRAGERTAYADGKPLYKALAEGVETHGKELEKKEAEEKAKTAPPSGGSTPPSSGGSTPPTTPPTTTPPTTPPSGGTDQAHDAFTPR